MRLNVDCVRDILLCIEEQSKYGGILRFSSASSMIDEFPRLQSYSEDEIAYHARQCYLSDFFYEYKPFANGSDGFSVSDLSPKGHEFLANIRQDNIWNSVKDISAKVGSKSLSAVAQIASSVITEIIKAKVLTMTF